jgi:hypothetical protein
VCDEGLEAASRSDSNQQAGNKQNKRQAEQTPRSLAISGWLTAPMKKPGLAARASSFVCRLCVCWTISAGGRPSRR